MVTPQSWEKWMEGSTRSRGDAASEGSCCWHVEDVLSGFVQGIGFPGRREAGLTFRSQRIYVLRPDDSTSSCLCPSVDHLSGFALDHQPSRGQKSTQHPTHQRGILSPKSRTAEETQISALKLRAVFRGWAKVVKGIPGTELCGSES